VGDRHEGAKDVRDGQHGQDEHQDDAAVAGARPVRRWAPGPLLGPWCRYALAAAVAAQAHWVDDPRGQSGTPGPLRVGTAHSPFLSPL